VNPERKETQSSPTPLSSVRSDSGVSDDEATVRAFVTRPKRDRFLCLLGEYGARGRHQVCLQLAHLRDLDTRWASRVATADATPTRIEELLRERGAGDSCHLLSESHELDGRWMALGDALTAVVGSSYGTFVTCIPGRLAYFEGEEPGERWLLQRP
jgi:hypothetical protein